MNERGSLKIGLELVQTWVDKLMAEVGASPSPGLSQAGSFPARPWGRVHLLLNAGGTLHPEPSVTYQLPISSIVNYYIITAYPS